MVAPHLSGIRTHNGTRLGEMPASSKILEGPSRPCARFREADWYKWHGRPECHNLPLM